VIDSDISYPNFKSKRLNIPHHQNLRKDTIDNSKNSLSETNIVMSQKPSYYELVARGNNQDKNQTL